MHLLKYFSSMVRRSNKKHKAILNEVLRDQPLLESVPTEIELLLFYIRNCYNWTQYKPLKKEIFSSEEIVTVFQFVEENAANNNFLSVKRVNEHFPAIKFPEYDASFEANDAIDYLSDLYIKRLVKENCLDTLAALSAGDNIGTVEQILQSCLTVTAQTQLETDEKYSKKDFLEYLERLDSKKPFTHYEDLDDYLKCALDAYIVIAGRPAHGKTALALNILQKIAESSSSEGLALFFSIEMNEQQLYHRLLSIITGLNMNHVVRLRGDIKNETIKQAMKKMFEDYNIKLKIFHDSSTSILDIETKVKAFVQTNEKINCIVVDYFQIIQNNKEYKDDLQKYTDVSRRLKKIVQDYNIPLIVLTQMNREVEKRPDKRPLKSDLKGCGAIEENADVIIMLDTPFVKGKEIDDRRVDLVIVKNKFGAVGICEMLYQKESQKFFELPLKEKKQQYIKKMPPTLTNR